MHDPVSPSYYELPTLGIGWIDIIEAAELNFHEASAVQYIARAGKKNVETREEDLRKAIWYLSRCAPPQKKLNHEAPLVFFAHPVRGDVEGNLKRARASIKNLEAVNTHWTIVAPWILTCENYDDANEEERAAGIARNLRVIESCDYIFLAGGRVSEGMKQEKEHAEKHGLRVVDATQQEKGKEEK